MFIIIILLMFFFIQITFDDVKGCDEAKKELLEVVDFLKHPEKFINLGKLFIGGILIIDYFKQR